MRLQRLLSSTSAYAPVLGAFAPRSFPVLRVHREQVCQEVTGSSLGNNLWQKCKEKYEEAMGNLAEMEKRLVMAESMLEATLQYQSGQNKPSPRFTQKDSSMVRCNQDSSPEIPARKISLLSRPFGLGWRDKNKGKPAEEVDESKLVNEETSPNTEQKEMNGHQMEEKLHEV